MGKKPRRLSVGRLDFKPVRRKGRKWGVIGCAPRLDPHWLLYHYEHRAARLVLLFDDDDHAKMYVGACIDRNYLRRNETPLKKFMVHQVHDLCIAPSLSVASVAGRPELLNWMLDVVENRLTELPHELAETQHDVLFLPRLNGGTAGLADEIAMDDAFRAGTLTLLRDSLCGAGITYENPRTLRL
jgi:hypothetical protein